VTVDAGSDTAAKPSVTRSGDECRFALRFAAHLGIIPGGPGLFSATAGSDPVAQIAFAHEQGFTVMEDNFLRARAIPVQNRIGQALRERHMTLGCFLGITIHDRPTFACRDPQSISLLIEEIKKSIEVACRVGGRSLTIIPGRLDPNVPRSDQLQAAIANLQQLAPLAEAANIVLHVEAISRKRWDDILISHVDDAYALCKSVGSRAVKVLFDVFQCQRESGDLIASLDRCWDEIGYIQIADNPGRCEPGTGEINFENVLTHIKRRGWTGLVGLEHDIGTPGQSGVNNVLDTYRRLNAAIWAGASSPSFSGAAQ
jgi:hydroxypyruvate isomerase